MRSFKLLNQFLISRYELAYSHKQDASYKNITFQTFYGTSKFCLGNFILLSPDGVIVLVTMISIISKRIYIGFMIHREYFKHSYC
jgi:hypothetical protein